MKVVKFGTNNFLFFSGGKRMIPNLMLVYLQKKNRYTHKYTVLDKKTDHLSITHTISL